MVLTTIPSRIVREPPNADGHSQWIVNGPTKNKVLTAPGYSQPVPKHPGSKSYAVKSTPTMGLGVFATRDIPLSKIIFAERPLSTTLTFFVAVRLFSLSEALCLNEHDFSLQLLSRSPQCPLTQRPQASTLSFSLDWTKHITMAARKRNGGWKPGVQSQLPMSLAVINTHRY